MGERSIIDLVPLSSGTPGDKGSHPERVCGEAGSQLGLGVSLQGSNTGDTRDQLQPGDFPSEAELQQSVMVNGAIRIEGSTAGGDPFVFTADGLEFVPAAPGATRNTPLAVALLIDNSGSIKGFVEEGTIGGGDSAVSCVEGPPKVVDIPSTLNDCHSDPTFGAPGAAETILATLRPADRAISFTFGEKVGISAACPSGARPDGPDGEAACLGSPAQAREAVKRLMDHDDAHVLGEGRSNLWGAVVHAMDLLRKHATQPLRHVVVITDGPDTCDAKSPDFQHCFSTSGGDPTYVGGCPTAASAEVDAAIAQTPAVAVSFIHFQSPGYPHPDPRMIDAACRSGGHYLFVPTRSIPPSGTRAMLEKAARRLRGVLRGHWRANLKQTLPLASGMPKGNSTLLSGKVAFYEGDLNKHEFGTGKTALTGPLVWSSPCKADSDCGAGGGAKCGVGCDPVTRRCTAPAWASSCGGGDRCCGQCTSSDTACADTDRCP